MPPRDILIFCEAGAGQTEAATDRLLAAGDALGRQTGGRLLALLVGHGLEQAGADLARCVDELFVADAPPCAQFNPEAYLPLLHRVAQEARPVLILLGHTWIGMDLGPRLAARLGAGFAANCLEVGLEGEGVTCVRPVFQGRLHARVALGGTPAVVTLQLGGEAARPVRAGRVTRLDVPPADDPAIRTLRTLEPPRDGVDIAKAPIVVAGGRGIGNKENFRLVEELAEALGGVPACSRPLVDMGWLGPAAQVGLSGKTVKPRLYVACGISGAVEHLAGMRDAQTIVAINNDPDAPIFKVAHYGIVGDLNDVIPAMIAEVRACSAQ